MSMKYFKYWLTLFFPLNKSPSCSEFQVVLKIKIFAKICNFVIQV